jgi:hypothetical protein
MEKDKRDHGLPSVSVYPTGADMVVDGAFLLRE